MRQYVIIGDKTGEVLRSFPTGELAETFIKQCIQDNVSCHLEIWDF